MVDFVRRKFYFHMIVTIAMRCTIMKYEMETDGIGLQNIT